MADLRPLFNTRGPGVLGAIDRLTDPNRLAFNDIPEGEPHPLDAPPIAKAAMGGGLQALLPPLATPNVISNPRIGDSNNGRQSLIEADRYKRENPIAPTTTLGKIGHVAAGIGNILGDIFAPATMALIPGTELHNQLQINRDSGKLDDISRLETAEAGRKDQTAQTVEREALGRKAGAIADSSIPIPLTADEANSIGHPEYEGLMISPRDKAKFFGTTQTNDTRQGISDDKLEAAAKAAAAKPEQRDDHYITIMAKPPGQRTSDDLAYKQGYEGYIKAKLTDPRVAGALARPVQVVLPTGQAGYETAGTAIKTGATGLGDNSYKAEGAALKDFTSGTDAHTLTAFNTAKGHLQQLAVAGDALQNGDVQVLNKIANSYGAATGQSAPAVFQGVKTAVSGEIAKAFTGAGATVDEISEIRKSINDANSPEQLHAVINSYSHLLDTKSGVLRDQFAAAKKGQPNFGAPPPSSNATPKVGDTRSYQGHTYRFDGKGWTQQ